MRAREIGIWRVIAFFVLVCVVGVAQARSIAVDLAWQAQVPGAVLPDAQAWKLADRDRLTTVARTRTGAWLRLTPVSGTWPDTALGVELNLRAQAQVTLLDAKGAEVLTTSLDAPAPGLQRGNGVLLIPVARPADLSAPILLRIDRRASGDALVDVVVRTAADEFVADNRRLAFLSACLSLLVCTAFYALVFGVVMRDVSYFHYATYVLGFAGIELLLTGYAANLLGMSGVQKNHPWAVALCTGISSWGAAQFLCSFVDLPRYAPRTARGLRWLANFLLVACALTLLPATALLHALKLTIDPLLIAASIAMLCGSLIALARGSRYVRFYLFGWLPLLAATIVDSGQSLGAFDSRKHTSEALLGAGTFETMVLVFAITWRARDLRSDRDRTRLMAETDGLTGILNRRGWQAHLETRLARARQRREPVAVMFLDLDHFKAFNDRHGHACGDRLLVAVATAIIDELRPADLFGRWGGEEFVILLPGCDTQRATATAERVRARVETVQVPVDGGTAGTTASIGVSAIAAAESPESALSRADAAMYASKRGGRNRTSMA